KRLSTYLLFENTVESTNVWRGECRLLDAFRDASRDHFVTLFLLLRCSLHPLLLLLIFLHPPKTFLHATTPRFSASLTSHLYEAKFDLFAIYLSLRLFPHPLVECSCGDDAYNDYASHAHCHPHCVGLSGGAVVAREALLLSLGTQVLPFLLEDALLGCPPFAGVAD
ncbi:hypothetical protein PENTCL1PPCAC_13729, partial [Pristionchus entomophagus]